MNGVRSGRSLDEVRNAPEKFLIDLVLVEPGMEFTVAVGNVEINVFDEAELRERSLAHKAIAIVDCELRASNGLAYPVRLLFSKQALTDLWNFDHASTVALVPASGTSDVPDYDPPGRIKLCLQQVGMLALHRLPVTKGAYPIDRIARLHWTGHRFESVGWIK